MTEAANREGLAGDQLVLLPVEVVAGGGLAKENFAKLREFGGQNEQGDWRFEVEIARTIAEHRQEDDILALSRLVFREKEGSDSLARALAAVIRHEGYRAIGKVNDRVLVDKCRLIPDKSDLEGTMGLLNRAGTILSWLSKQPEGIKEYLADPAKFDSRIIDKQLGPESTPEPVPTEQPEPVESTKRVIKI